MSIGRLACAAFLCIFATGALAAELPATTKRQLTAMKLDSSILAGLDPQVEVRRLRSRSDVRHYLETLPPGPRAGRGAGASHGYR